MATHGINAIGLLIGNPDEIVFVLTKGDVERLYNMMNHLDLGTHLPESVWGAFKQNMYRLDERLDHAAAIEDILAEYCRVPITVAPPLIPIPLIAAPAPPLIAAPPPPAPPAEDTIYDAWHNMQRKRYDTKKFQPPGYGKHIVWSAHRVRAFMVALNLKPTVYDTNLRTLANLAGVHPYDFHWKTNPISFGAKRGLSVFKMRQMMGDSAFYQMQDRFNINRW